MNNCFSFPAIRGVQAGHAAYMVMIKLKLIGRLLGTGRRRARTRRGSAIAEYLTASSCDYLLPALIITVAGDLRFESAGPDLRSVGRLSIDLGSDLTLVDGEQRIAGIAKAIALKPSLGEEAIPAMILAERDDGYSSRLRNDVIAKGRIPRYAASRQG